MEGKRSLSGAGIRYRGRVRKILCDCNSDVMDTGLSSFFLYGLANDTCPICAYPYYYKHDRDDQPVVKEGEQPGNYSGNRLVEERGLRATLIGGVVEYCGEIVTVQCKCSEHTLSRGASHLLTHPTVKPGETSNFDPPLSTLRDVLPDVWGRKEHAEYMARQKDIEFYNSLQPAAGVRDGLKRIMASIKGDPIDHMTHGPEDKTN